MICQLCGGSLVRVIIGNIIDYRHKGQCSAGWEPAAMHYQDIERTLSVGTISEAQLNSYN